MGYLMVSKENTVNVAQQLKEGLRIMTSRSLLFWDAAHSLTADIVIYRDIKADISTT